MSSFSREKLEEWLKTIDVSAERVLDIGGSQLPIKGRTKSWNVVEYKILDLEKPHEVKQQPDFIFDLNKDHLGLSKAVSYLNHFDVAFCLEVSEYLWNPVRALDIINGLLKSGGILYLSTHFIYPVHAPEGTDYLRYTRDGIIRILKETGFEIKELKERPVTGVNMRDFYLGQGMRPGKTYKYHSEVGHLIKAIKI